MGSQLTTSLAFLLALNLFFFTSVNSTTTTCPIDTLKLGVCANVLGDLVNVVVGTPPKMPCCSLINGLVDLEAAVCLCTALRANILGINLDVPLSLSVLLNYCGNNVPSGFECHSIMSSTASPPPSTPSPPSTSNSPPSSSRSPPPSSARSPPPSTTFPPSFTSSPPPPTIKSPPQSARSPPPSTTSPPSSTLSPPPSTPSPPPSTPSQGTCPRDALKLGVCANLLGDLVHLVVGTPPKTPCCSLIDGLVDLEAAVCLCTAIRANVLGINLNIPVSLSLLLNYCGKNVPSGFQCA